MDKKTKEELIKKGTLKPLSEAFKEYPVQEEIHFGITNGMWLKILLNMVNIIKVILYLLMNINIRMVV